MADIPAADATLDAFLNARLMLLQPKSGHRAGTDALLLAAACPEHVCRLADLGAASGIVGLSALKLGYTDHVALIENDPGLVALARRNIGTNGLCSHAEVIAADAFGIARNPALRNRFDCVLTNPPFLRAEAVRVSPVERRARAHVFSPPIPAQARVSGATTAPSSLDRWLRNVAGVLLSKGICVMIHRADALEDILAACRNRFGALKLIFVHAHAGQPAIRVLVYGVKGSRAPLEILPPLVLHAEDGAFTPRAAAIHAGESKITWASGR